MDAFPTRQDPPSTDVNGMQADARFEQLARYVGFEAADAEELRSLAEPLGPHLSKVVKVFFAAVDRHEATHAVLEQSGAKVADVQDTLLRWLHELFCGVYDEQFYRRHGNLGRIHLSIQLPQHFMIMGMSVIRAALIEQLCALDPPRVSAKLQAVNKLLDLELAMMLETYHRGAAELIRSAERAAMESRLLESEHLASIGQLAATLAHEIKNPLAGISGAIQVIGASLPRGNPHKEVVAEVLTEIDRLDATARDLLIYSRPKPPARKKHQVGRLLQGVLMDLRQEPALQGLRIRYEGLKCAAEASIDELQFRQVVTNVLLNAAHACEEGGEVAFRLSSDDAMVRIEVNDTGVGMSPEDVARAFEPFHTTKAKGTGLGLSICQWIVESHGGTIAVQSALSEGTSVTIEFPCQS